MERQQQQQDADSEVEDTSDETYLARHCRFEAEEIRRDRISEKRLAEEQLRQKLEQRDKESWVSLIHTRTCRVHACTCVSHSRISHYSGVLPT